MKQENLTPSSAGHRKRIKDKYEQSGVVGWHDYEIVELVLSYAIPRKDTKPIAKELIKQFKTIAGVLDADPKALQRIEGLSSHSTTLLKLIKDLAMIYQKQGLAKKDLLASPQLVYEYLKVNLKGLAQEEFWIVLLDTRNQLIATETVGKGVVNQAIVFPRQVVERALYHHACAVIISHNHPAGSLTPSKEDLNLTQAINQALKTVDIKLLDHIIVGGNEYLSFREQGIGY